jgi:hypothetical protein
MTKSKALSIIAAAPNPAMAAQLHQCVITAGAISAASAILCGQQLAADQKALKSSSITFDQWFDKHEKSLGFSRRTAFKYIGAFKDTKAKLLKTGNKATLALLEAAPHNLSKEDREKLLKAVGKCIGSQTLSDIYLEAGIVKNVHKAPLRIGGGDSSSDEPATERDLDKEAQELLDTIGERSLSLKKTYQIGKKQFLILHRAPKPRVKTLLDILKNDLRVVVEIYNAMEESK